MSRLTDLLKAARKLDAQLGADLEAEFRALSKRRTFGLVFERHRRTTPARATGSTTTTTSRPMTTTGTDFAADYGNEFRRIESVAETDGKLRVLDFTREDVREVVHGANDARTLYRSDAATDYA